MDADVARPTSEDDRDGWKAYWTAQGMAWRTEPEIDTERQQFLAARRALTLDLHQGIYPFRDVTGPIRLSRGDIEWLLATHESSGVRGPVEWADVSQRGRKGIDLRGGDLRGVFLRTLPLARTIGGWLLDEEPNATPEQLESAAVHLEGADFRGGFEHQTHLEGARLTGAHLEKANLYRARLEGAGLDYTHLQGSDLSRAHLEFASLAQARLAGQPHRHPRTDVLRAVRHRLDAGLGSGHRIGLWPGHRGGLHLDARAALLRPLTSVAAHAYSGGLDDNSTPHHLFVHRMLAH